MFNSLLYDIKFIKNVFSLSAIGGLQSLWRYL